MHIDTVFIVGRIAEIIQINNIQINLIINISYKNIQEDDIIRRKALVTVNNTMSEKINQHCKQGDMISVKCHVDMNSDNQNILVADQVSFLVPGQ